jgi:putative ABC transport system permease protein
VGLVRALQTFAAREDTDPTEIAVTVTSPNLFDVLGVQPSLGRGFARSEVGPGRSPVIVLTHHLWNRLGADRTIPGRVVRLNGEPYTVIGVMPSTFTFVLNAGLGPTQRVDAFTTFNVNLAGTNPVAGAYSGLIRARCGTPPETVAAAVDAVGRSVDARDFQSRGLKLYPVGLKTDLVASVRPALLVLAFAGLILVLVLMVNLASVLLARAVQREHEFAVSRALGANGVAIIRATLFEGGLLGLIGGVLGALVAIWGTRALVVLAPLELPRRESIAVDWGIAAVVIVLGVVLGLLAATGAATWAARTSLSTLLASSAVRGGGGHGRMRRGMIVAQVALSLVLLSTGGLLIRSFERLLRADPGFRPEGLLTLRVPTPAPFFPQLADAVLFYDRVEQALAAIPGVKGVSAATAVPLTGSARQATIKFPGAPGNTGDADRDMPLVDFVAARAGYVEVMGIRVLAGRALEKARRNDAREALIDATLARQFFPASSPLGAKLQFGANANMVFTVVGVVEQARLHNVHQNDRPQVFVQDDFRGLSFVIRSDREPRSLIPGVRAAVRGLDPRIALSDVRTMDEIISDALRQQRIIALLIAAFALGALLLAAMGLFGVVSGSVTRRRHELAVRLALGADHQGLVRLVLREGALLVGLGVVIGVPGLYIAGGLIRGVLVGVSPSDPVTLVAVALGLVLITMATCYVPARRALRIEPAQLLRQE